MIEFPKLRIGGPWTVPAGQLRLTARVRELVDQGTALEAACRIVTLEDQLQQARADNTETTRLQAERPFHRCGACYRPRIQTST
jgi:hypothetical protein